jgi:hypothetical protein
MLDFTVGRERERENLEWRKYHKYDGTSKGTHQKQDEWFLLPKLALGESNHGKHKTP